MCVTISNIRDDFSLSPQMESTDGVRDGGSNQYTVVGTINSTKDKSIAIHTVPSHWIVGNILYYPKDVATVGLNGMIMSGRFARAPEHKKWKKYALVIKKRFKQFGQAEAYVASIAGVESDSDEKDLKVLVAEQTKINKERSKYNHSRRRKLIWFWKHKYLSTFLNHIHI